MAGTTNRVRKDKEKKKKNKYLTTESLILAQDERYATGLTHASRGARGVSNNSVGDRRTGE